MLVQRSVILATLMEGLSIVACNYSDKTTTLSLQGKLNGYPNDIGLINIFRNFYGKQNTTVFLENFYISHKNGIKIFLKWFINKCALVNQTRSFNNGTRNFFKEDQLKYTEFLNNKKKKVNLNKIYIT